MKWVRRATKATDPAYRRLIFRGRASSRWLGIPLVVAGLILFLALVVWLVPWQMTRWSHWVNDVERDKAEADVRNGLVTSLVMLGAGGSLLFTMKTFRMNRTSSLTARFESAAKQIGDNETSVRLAGVYAMAQLADSWQDMRQACIDVLCAHIREDDNSGLTLDSPRHDPTSSQSAALRLICDRIRPTHRISWAGCDFDLTKARLKDADFTDARLSSGRIIFDSAEFRGEANFCKSQFVGSNVSFENAGFNFGCRVIFEEARFVAGSISFKCAKLNGGSVDFGGATFRETCRVDFEDAHFGNGDLFFKGADITGSGVTFCKASFEDLGRVVFDGTTFSGQTSFAGAKFRGDVDFGKAILKDAELSFNGSEFDRGHLSFQGAENQGARFIFDSRTRRQTGHIDTRRINGEQPQIIGIPPIDLILASCQEEASI